MFMVHPGSRIKNILPSRIRILDPGVKKAPDPGSATLILIMCFEVFESYSLISSYWENKNTHFLNLQESTHFAGIRSL
jgi:hypothetical protein